MEQSRACCPVCTLYLREGITLQDHLETHPKEKVIEALLRATNGGTASQSTPSQPSSGPAPVQTFVSPQSYVAPSTAYVSQTQNYVGPQAQMTTAVTYQQFVTSNGSTVIPQYIQVPTIVAPNNNVPIIPNQTLNYVPNQSSAYAHTMYNPLYNPYIPQPYPLAQQMYNNVPATTESSAQVSTSQTTSTAPSPTAPAKPVSKPDSVLKQVSTVATNTSSRKIITLRPKFKKVPVRSATQTKLRIIKQLGSRTKTTSSTMATVATKSYKINSINGKANSTAKASVITKAKSIRKGRPVLPRAISFSSTSKMITPPPPLTPMSRNRSGSISCSEAPPPPPLSKAPCLPPIPTSFELLGIIKTEKASGDAVESASDSQVLEKNCSTADNVANYLFHNGEAPSVNSVIVESNSAIQITSNIVITQSADGESVVDPSSGYSDSILPEMATDRCESAADEPRCDRSESNLGDDGNEHNPLSDYEDEEQLPEKVFHSIEIEEEKKVAFNFNILNHPVPSEADSEGVSGNCYEIGREGRATTPEDCQGKRMEPAYPKQSSITSTAGDGTAPDDVTRGDYANDSPQGSSETRAPTMKTNSARAGESAAQSEEVRSIADLKSLTYTDLQPATNTKVLQDLGITGPINLNNYIEVDGIRIFFSSAGPQNIPLEPIIKFTSTVKNDVTNVQTFMKAENELRENDSLVESVIHLVSGRANQKSDLTSEAFSNSNSHPSDGHLDLSPLTLNIQADESMPARGELSEQESLGAENSNWGLFHSEPGSAIRTSLIWKTNDDVRMSALSTAETDKTVKKVFKCSLCQEVFSCPKARRLHRSTAHEKSTASAPRKPKTFVCSHCKQPFATLVERRRHVIQNHFFDNKRNIKLESEAREEKDLAEDDLSSITITEMEVKLEDPEVKCEAAVSSQTNKSPCDITKNCPRCDLPVTGLNNLKDHMREVHGESRFKCGTCSEMFESERDYNSHLRIHPLMCDQCGKTFNRKPNLKLHLRRHLEVKPYICTLCPKSFITRQKLDEHVNGHSGNKPLKCTMCDSTFSRHSNLIQHRNIHHLNGKKKVKDFVCRCGEVFHSLRKLHWHKEVHDTKPKTCPFCSQKFIHSNSVTRHIRRSHMPDYLPDDKKYNENVQCPVCEKIYLRSSLIVHMRVHNGEKPFACKICSRRFTTKWNLELHNWTHQSRNNMPYKCTTCKSAFFREVDYVAHLNSHKNHRPFTCNICGQKFIRKYNCLRHQDEHKKEKKFVCTVRGCEKSFHRSYYLKDHMKVHTGVRPHTCHICGKASSTKSNHNKHVRIHDTREPVNTEN